MDRRIQTGHNILDGCLSARGAVGGKGSYALTDSILLFSLLRTCVGSEAAGEYNATDLTEDAIAAVYTLAKRHDMAHLLGHALNMIDYCNDGELSRKLHKQTMQAIYRCARQQNEFEQVARLFEEFKIPYIPLKGTVIRDWYPEPWMRTSTDIDILVRKEDLNAGIYLLTEKLGYCHKGTAFHDASLFSQSGMHLELHYELVDTTTPKAVSCLLSRVWDRASPSDGSAYRFDMDDDWFYLYHIFHMTKHLTNGGCGIKPFLDLWIMNREKGYCSQRFATLLESCGLLTVAHCAERLADTWFSGEDMDDLSSRFASFVLDGGVHGNVKGNVKVAQVRKGGRLQSLWQKIFLPYVLMKEHYPILSKHKWLLPGAEILRWIKLLFGSRFNRTARVLWENITVTGEERETTRKLLRDLDLI